MERCCPEAALGSLKMSSRVSTETLRLWPVMPFLDRICSENYEVPGTGVRIEKGTVVLIPSFSIHRDPEYYSDPDNFDPERFSPRNNNNSNNPPFLPFGSGPRLCIGEGSSAQHTEDGLSKRYQIGVASTTHNSLLGCHSLAVSSVSIVNAPMPLQGAGSQR